MTGSHDDQSLIERCRAGETEAFGILVRRYQDRLYPTVLRLSGDAEDARDLLQDAFIRAFEKLGRFRGGSTFYTWVYRIAVNLALSDRRKRRIVPRPSGRRDGPELDPAEDESRSDPSLPMERAERESAVQSALSLLSTEHRAVVVLKDLDGLRYEEIADVLHIPVGTVRSRLHRARSELRERLRGVVDMPPDPEESPARMAPGPASRTLAPLGPIDPRNALS